MHPFKAIKRYKWRREEIWINRMARFISKSTWMEAWNETKRNETKRAIPVVAQQYNLWEKHTATFMQYTLDSMKERKSFDVRCHRIASRTFCDLTCSAALFPNLPPSILNRQLSQLAQSSSTRLDSTVPKLACFLPLERRIDFYLQADGYYVMWLFFHSIEAISIAWNW